MSDIPKRLPEVPMSDWADPAKTPASVEVTRPVGNTMFDSTPLMRQLAAMANIPFGKIHRMVLVLELDDMPRLYTAEYLNQSDQPLASTTLHAAPLDVDPSVVVDRVMGVPIRVPNPHDTPEAVDTTSVLNEKFRTAVPRPKNT